jgi:hypothetical protein
MAVQCVDQAGPYSPELCCHRSCRSPCGITRTAGGACPGEREDAHPVTARRVYVCVGEARITKDHKTLGARGHRGISIRNAKVSLTAKEGGVGKPDSWLPWQPCLAFRRLD